MQHYQAWPCLVCATVDGLHAWTCILNDGFKQCTSSMLDLEIHAVPPMPCAGRFLNCICHRLADVLVLRMNRCVLGTVMLLLTTRLGMPLCYVVLRHCGLLPCIYWCLCNPVSPA